jgi:hypothetical protein
VLGFADLLGLHSAGDFGGFGVAGLAEDGEQDDPPAGRETVGDAGLLGEQVKPELADFPAEMAGIRFSEILGALVRAAVRYWASYPDEIDAEIAAADAAEDAAEQAWRREHQLLAR